MQTVTTKQIYQPEEVDNSATEKQIQYIKMLAQKLGFHVSTDKMSREKAAQQIDEFKRILRSEIRQKFKEQEVKLAMVKKLVYKKWVAQNMEISSQTEKFFMKEVYNIHKLFDRIDKLVVASLTR